MCVLLLLQYKGLPLPLTGRYKSVICSVPSRNLQQSGCTPLARQAGPAEGTGWSGKGGMHGGGGGDAGGVDRKGGGGHERDETEDGILRADGRASREDRNQKRLQPLEALSSVGRSRLNCRWRD